MHIFQFEAGEGVSLRSGGPLMTVTAAERIPVDKPVDPKAAPASPAQRRPDGSPLLPHDPGYVAPVAAPAPGAAPVPVKDVGPAVKCMWQTADGKNAEGSWPAGLLDLKDRIENHAHHMAAAAAKIAATHAAAAK